MDEDARISELIALFQERNSWQTGRREKKTAEVLPSFVSRERWLASLSKTELTKSEEDVLKRSKLAPLPVIAPVVDVNYVGSPELRTGRSDIGITAETAEVVSAKVARRVGRSGLENLNCQQKRGIVCEG